MQVNCETCGELFDRIPSEVEKKDHQFCSRECYHEWKRTDWEPPYTKEKVELTCEWCGDSFAVYPYRADSARFCSRDCSDESLTGQTGEDSVRWTGGKAKHTCKNCGDTFHRYDTDGRDCDYCSKSCYREASEELFAGENNPAWRGGRPDYYGPNWEEQRQAALERDGHRCQDCDKHADSMGRSPDVHHKKRLGWFREEYDAPEWWQKANRVDNLVTLCPSCHKKREWSSVD